MSSNLDTTNSREAHEAPTARPKNLRLWIKHRLWPGVKWVSRDKARIRHLFLRRTAAERIKTLDIGCGNGYFTYHAARLGSCAIGITMAERETRRCEEMRRYLSVPEETLRFLTTRLQDFAVQPEHAGHFDQILMFDVLEHIMDHDQALELAKGMLTTDGFLFVSVPNRDYERDPREAHVERHETGWHVRHGYSFEQLEALLDQHGFEPIDRRRFGTKGTKLIVSIQRKLLRERVAPSVILLPVFQALAWLLAPWKDPHTLLVIARKRGDSTVARQATTPASP